MIPFKSIYRFFSSKYQSVHLDYKVELKPRFTDTTDTFGLLYKIVNNQRDEYKKRLEGFILLKSQIHSIQKMGTGPDDSEPRWNNGYLPGLDIIGIYGMIAEMQPSMFLEIGSGNSTMVARKCIREQGLRTQIVSVDPYPRAAIDHLSDQVIRSAVENVENLKSITSKLQKGDILFIDNSHRVLPNSDALICFLEIMPFLKPGVIVHIHDIYIPYDYPQFMCDRLYNEQYVLMAFMISNPKWFKVLLPNYFISEDTELSTVLNEIWNHPNLEGVERHGGSFWVEMNG
ncbi:MAG: class I SAM-dependent methyltransferase [Flavobacteriales bacterium]|nr:class I SAM-dependent methyltransferase [Flavobacteriales bacterium]